MDNKKFLEEYDDNGIIVNAIYDIYEYFHICVNSSVGRGSVALSPLIVSISHTMAFHALLPYTYRSHTVLDTPYHRHLS